MPQTSVSRNLVNALPLPGVDEIASVAKGLIARMQAAGCERNQCESLVRRLNGLIAAANVCNGLDGFAEILSELQAVKSRFETALKSRSKFSEILQAQNRLRAYDNLGQELTELMEKAQLQLLASNRKMLIEDRAQLNQMLIEHRVQYSKMSIEQNFKTIGQCDISFDDTESPTWAPSAQTGSRELVRQPKQVAIQCRRGRLGKLRVIYTSFSAHSDHSAATEKAEEELKHLSRIQHPNIAVVVGVTRGYDGLNGLVLAMDGISLDRFAQMSVAGAALARLINGFMQLGDFIRQRKDSSDHDDIGYGAITVAPNGHVTLLVLREGPSDDSDSSEDGDPDPVVELATDICNDELNFDDPSINLRSELMLQYIKSLASLGQAHPTELQLLKIAAECGFNPESLENHWGGTVAPSFTLCPGDLGSLPRAGYWGEAWLMLEAFSGSNTESHIYDPKDWKHTFSWQSMPKTHSQYQTWVSDCHCELPNVIFQHCETQKEWKDVLKKAQNVSKRQRLELDHILYVKSMTFRLMAARSSSSTQLMADARLYFHRNPRARAAPSEFWGFFSTSPDPCASSTRLEDLGWTFNYELNYQTVCVGDAWERKYQEALHEGLATIPGAYPGAHVEELSDDEDLYADEELSDDESE